MGGEELGTAPPGQYWAFLGVSLMTLPAAAALARCIVHPPHKNSWPHTNHHPVTPRDHLAGPRPNLPAAWPVASLLLLPPPAAAAAAAAVERKHR